MKRLLVLFALCVARSVSGEALCVLCPDPTLGSAVVSTGVATVDGIDHWRGSRLPWVDDGAYPQVDIDFDSEITDGRRLDSRLSIDSDTDYFGSFGGGRQGDWSLDATIRGYGIRDAGGARTSYDGAGSDNLVLPEDWTPGPSTDRMPDLVAALGPVEIGADHRDTKLGLRTRVGAHWHLNASVIERKVEGKRATGGVIGSNNRNGRAAILPAPVAQTTRNFEIAGDYTGDLDSVSLALRVSEYRNDNDRLGWDNAYSNGVPRGSQALAPDNQFLQLDLAGVHRFSLKSQFSFQVAYGQATQDQRFEPYTVNPALVVEPLPRDSLDGERNSWVAAARFAHQFGNELALDVDFRFEDLNNRTDQNQYSPIIGDFRESFMVRTNLGYDFTKQQLGARLAYPVTAKIRLQGGVDLSRMDRSDREVEHADDLELWGAIRWRFLSASNVSLRAERGYRRGDDYSAVENIEPPENPLLRKYSMADQDHWTVQATASHPLSDRLTLGAQVRAGRIDYPDTRIGLSATDETSVSLDLGYSPNGDWSASLFGGYNRFQSDQLGSAVFAEPDWRAQIDDSTVSVGGAFSWHPLESRWEHSVEFSLVDGQSDVSVNNDPFPEVGADLQRLVYRGSYQVDERFSAGFEFWYERFDENDWAVQNVAPDTVATVLSLGEDARAHAAVAAVVMLSYKF